MVIVDQHGGTRMRRIPRSAALLLASAAFALAVPFGIVLASHQFTDVPNSNLFHNDIDALVDSHVTTGCATNPPRYCPNNFVTRGQMAAFLNRLGALGPGTTPVVNADRLDGLDSSAFGQALFAVINANATIARGVGVVSAATVSSAGQYEVIFDRNVRECAYTVTTGGTGSTETPAPGYGVATGRMDNVNGVFIRTFNSAGTVTALAFHLQVSCAAGAAAVVGQSIESPDTPSQP
jgi:hypothetical protein